MRFILLFTLCFAAVLPNLQVRGQASALRPVDLTTDFRRDPTGIATPTPSFAWTLQPTSAAARNLRQTAYRIRLAKSVALLSSPAHSLWNSGRVVSAAYWQRPYPGPALQSHTTYFWQVQTFNNSGTPGPWSAVAHFTTALLSQQDWHAHWIAADPDRPTAAMASEHGGDVRSSDPPPLPVFRHTFTLTRPVASALLFVTGLGQYEAHLNGVDVTPSVMNPGWTNYRKTVPYDSYDVTKLVHTGTNGFGVLLGNGMYNVERVKGHYTKFAGSFGQPKCLLQLEVVYTDGTAERIVSDRTWQTQPGPVLYSSTFGGEVFDARVLPGDWDRAGASAQGWRAALEVEGPGGTLSATQSAPIVIAESFKPVHTSRPRPGVTVYDLGKVMSGWPSIKVSGSTGDRVDLLAGELLNPDGTVSQKSANAQADDPVLFSYVLHGGAPESWHPRFAYYSFRYVQVSTSSPTTKAPTLLSIAGDFVHSDATPVGNFETSNQLFGGIHNLIDRAVLSNLASIVTDCPSREKLGWLEQTYLNAATLMLNYNVTGLYEKMSEDIRDAQLADGLVPSTAPEYVAFLDDKGRSNAFRDSPEWGSAIVLSPWALYQYTGDMRPLRTSYAAMQRYVAYLDSRSRDSLLNYGLGDWYDIGPKPPGPSQLTSRFVTATGVYFEDLVTMEHIATLLGNTADADMYKRRSAAVREAFNQKLFHASTDQYDRGSQAANAVPLALGLVPPAHVQAVLANLVADIHAHGDHVTAGDIGFHYVVRALTDNGRSDVLAAMFSRTDKPSYGYQLARGATTLTEAWDANPESSQNHFMLGHGEEWFYRGLAGLSFDMARGPEQAIHLTPSFLESVPDAAASLQTPLGLTSIRWKHTASHAVVDVSVPAAAVAQLKLPAGDWREAGASVLRSTGLVRSSQTDGTLELTLASGVYRFSRTSASPLSKPVR